MYFKVTNSATFRKIKAIVSSLIDSHVIHTLIFPGYKKNQHCLKGLLVFDRLESAVCQNAENSIIL